MTFDPEAFVREYSAAFDASDGEKIADVYNVPCLTVRGDGSLHIFGTRTEIVDFFQNVVDTYRKEGMNGFTCSNTHTEPLGAACANFTCDWEMMRDDQSVIRKWRQTYTFKHDPDRWRVIAAIFHTE